MFRVHNTNHNNRKLIVIYIVLYLIDRVQGAVSIPVVELQAFVPAEVCWPRELAVPVPVVLATRRASRENVGV